MRLILPPSMGIMVILTMISYDRLCFPDVCGGVFRYTFAASVVVVLCVPSAGSFFCTREFEVGALERDCF